MQCVLIKTAPGATGNESESRLKQGTFKFLKLFQNHIYYNGCYFEKTWNKQNKKNALAREKKPYPTDADFPQVI